MDACIALSQFGNRSSGIPIMIGLLSQKETKNLHGWIRSTLKQFTGQSFTEDQQWIDWWKTQPGAAPPDDAEIERGKSFYSIVNISSLARPWRASPGQSGPQATRCRPPPPSPPALPARIARPRHLAPRAMVLVYAYQ